MKEWITHLDFDGHEHHEVSTQELIRCKDCRFYDKTEDALGAWVKCARRNEIMQTDEDFCSFAERRKECQH